MAQSTSQPSQIRLPDAAATEALGRRIAAALGPGDVVCLYGALGAGKTTLARGLIGALCPDAGEVPSPTYTLVQTYRADGFDLWHVDLYRLEGEDESLELGLEDAFDAHVSVIEWPERLGRRLPPDRLEVRLAETEDGGRIARLEGHGASGKGAWRDRIAEI